MSVLHRTLLGLLLLDVFFGASLLRAQDEMPASPQPDTAGQPAPRVYPIGNDTGLGSRVASLLSDPALAHAHWGIAVTAMDGTPLYGLDEEKLFRPASTAKLFTTAAAMAILGPLSTVTTSVYFPSPSADGTVAGDITLVGRGDANLSGRVLPWTPAGNTAAQLALDPLHDFADMAAAVAVKGVHHITGNVVASSWQWDPYPQGWEAEDLPWGYGAPVSALSVNDNEILLTVLAGRTPGAPASVKMSPELGVYRVVANVSTADAASTSRGVTVHHTPGDGTLTLEGSLSPGKSFTAEIAIDDPPRFAAEALRQALISHGIIVDGSVTAARTEPEDIGFLHETRRPIPPTPNVGVGRWMGSSFNQRPLVIDHLSAPLTEDVTVTLKDSLNLHAELMLRDLGTPSALLNGNSATVEGARIVHQWLVNTGISDQDFVFYDGSGLSTKDLVTPRAEAQLLAYAATQRWFAQWKAALPVGGVDGTLASRFTEPPLKGHVFAKTGTLGESRALAGYVLCASGHEVIFSILDDDHEPGSSADRVVMDKIVAAIASSY